MPRPALDSLRLSLLLQAGGVMGGGEILGRLGVSSPTLSRMVKGLGVSVERIGAARRSRYALRREVRSLGWEWPVYRLNERGVHRVWGMLRALHGGFRFVPADTFPSWWAGEYADGVFSGLPFFLQEVRPQGFLGRSLVQGLAERYGVTPDLRRWSDDDALTYFLMEGDDLPGDIVVGDRAMERAVRRSERVATDAIRVGDRERVYPELATAVQRGGWIGSSAGGEQPKFLATVTRASGEFRPVIVKFSAAEASPVSQRWADLLGCEHLALETLGERGVRVARTEILDAAGRRFLEVERFDRLGAVGRRSVLSLGGLEDAWVTGTSSDWVGASAHLSREGWTSEADARTLRWVWCFGALIGNTDMHRGNLGFWFGDAPPFGLAPVYDMLPMLYAPGSQGDLSEREFSPGLPLAAVADVWSEAAAAAVCFWERVAADGRISHGLRRLADANGKKVARPAGAGSAKFEE
ncbi:MAG: type II toxin-antitoxin system HipA family toxin YjjJ [Opitutaceae bacterium]